MPNTPETPRPLLPTQVSSDAYIDRLIQRTTNPEPTAPPPTEEQLAAFLESSEREDRLRAERQATAEADRLAREAQLQAILAEEQSRRERWGVSGDNLGDVDPYSWFFAMVEEDDDHSMVAIFWDSEFRGSYSHEGLQEHSPRVGNFLERVGLGTEYTYLSNGSFWVPYEAGRLRTMQRLLELGFQHHPDLQEFLEENLPSFMVSLDNPPSVMTSGGFAPTGYEEEEDDDDDEPVNRPEEERGLPRAQTRPRAPERTRYDRLVDPPKPLAGPGPSRFEREMKIGED